MNKLRVLDLFAGLGGFSLGLERTGGIKTVAFCEIEPFPRRVLAKHWPKVPQYDDIRTLTKDVLDRDGIAVDVITGGFPCQDISTSGSGLGLAGKRSGLWYEYARLIGELRPSFVIVENSPELLDGWIGDILGTLASFGYDAEWHCIPASHVGAPHRRDRVWIIAYASRLGLSRQGQLVKSIIATPEAFGQANQLERAFQKGDLPYVCRGHDGIPPPVDRDAIKALGNAVVPQIPELIGNAILDSIGWRESDAA
jgi:DNA (cytosine-5)-methyltransferase 1